MSPPNDPASSGRPTTHPFDDHFHADCRNLLSNMEKVVRGKSDVLTLVLVGLLAEGHVLIEDVPGVGKTSIARALAASIKGTCHRIQFTPDLLPADVTGTPVLNPRTHELVFREGPVFANVVVADEINRASPKAQSALLEVMEERQVTADKESRPVPRPFVVLATQNPIEMRGTNALPEAQLDRFLLCIAVDYPDRAAEREILRLYGGAPRPLPGPVIDAHRAEELIAQCAAVHVNDAVRDYVLDIVEGTRTSPEVRVGASPRASIALVRAARAHAALSGRAFVVVEDVDAVAVPVLAHRLVLEREAEREGRTGKELVDGLLALTVVAQSAPAG